jgi:ribosome assembly protein RRB1
MEIDQKTFIVGRNKLEPGQTLSPDLSTYEMLHALSMPWPCLSFDIIKDNMGNDRKAYPATMYAVAGTQAESRREKENQLMVMKFSGLSRMERDQDAEESSDEEEEDADPILESKSIPLTSTTNRVRVHQSPAPYSSQAPVSLTASMTEAGQVLIHDITPHLTSFDIPGTSITSQQNKPLSTLRMHKSEGYAVDWSSLVSTGKLVTGDNDGLIFVTTRTAGEGWTTDSRPFTGHTGSVEELQWSPSERDVFASASSDGTIKVWDVRSKSRTAAISVQVSNTDVNVMSWSRIFSLLGPMMVSGRFGTCGNGSQTAHHPRQQNPHLSPASTSTRSRSRASSGIPRMTVLLQLQQAMIHLHYGIWRWSSTMRRVRIQVVYPKCLPSYYLSIIWST